MLAIARRDVLIDSLKAKDSNVIEEVSEELEAMEIEEPIAVKTVAEAITLDNIRRGNRTGR